MNKSFSSGSNQLLQEIDQKMRIIESMLILRYISGHVPIEEAYEVHQMLLEGFCCKVKKIENGL
ncbi:hypothetical protein [Bacillus sp. FDAARGOS_1420]|uniref:hypothetical protein n=1 Tax=unclassified Bacillus (in: firmicutes) TaxID=185979 RepID=UPI001C5BD35E|nr:hypothetical protein [Bacillus sp. FDAARGOS_1420]MBW3496513.1 hypothetical protein [Bacillus sp. FDAARGOS_1420]